MNNNFDFLKLQLSQGFVKDKDGKVVGIVLVFRPDIDVEEPHFFEYTGTNSFVLCIEVGSDGFPVRCIRLYKNLNEYDVNEYKSASDDEILEMFKLCYNLLSKKRDDDKMTESGKEILDDILPHGENNGF